MFLSKDDLTQQHYSEAAAPFGFISAVWRNGGGVQGFCFKESPLAMKKSLNVVSITFILLYF